MSDSQGMTEDERRLIVLALRAYARQSETTVAKGYTRALALADRIEAHDL